MQKNFMAIAKQGELERELKITTSNIVNAYMLLKKQKTNKKWDFELKDMYEVNVNWEKIEVVEEVEEEEKTEGETATID